MARVLAISSQVVRGHVGNSAAAFALQRLGHEVWMMPTVVLSNHPGHAHVAGTRILPSRLREILDALARNGWLGEVDAVMTGYLPTSEHVDFACDAIEQIRARGRKPLVLVDPVLGDDPGGLYVSQSAAGAVRERLVPQADSLTPNRFELEFLADTPVTGEASAVEAAARLGCSEILATSIPGASSHSLVNLLWRLEGVRRQEVACRANVPHGTGDLLAALFLGHMLQGEPSVKAMPLAVRGVASAIEASAGFDELRLVSSQDQWAGARFEQQ